MPRIANAAALSDQVRWWYVDMDQRVPPVLHPHFRRGRRGRRDVVVNLGCLPWFISHAITRKGIHHDGTTTTTATT